MHGLAVIGAATPDLLDRSVEDCRNSRTPLVEIGRSGDGRTAILVSPGEAPVVSSWSSPEGVVAAFGSSVEFLSPAELRREVERAFDDGWISHQAADLVAVATTGNGEASVLSGTGPHRLFRRQLPDGSTCVSNHLATVVRLFEPAPVDRSWEDFLLGFGFVPEGRTMFQGVTTLPPGSRWTVGSKDTDPLEVREPAIEPEERTGSELLDLLLALVEARTADRDHYAVLLGGFDSALVCALLRRLGKEVTGFTFDFGDPRYNQSNIDLVQRSLGIDHRWVPITPDRMRDALRTLTDLQNGPSPQPHYQLHTVLAAEDIAAEGFTLALNGDGCDAAFLGYPTIRQRSQLTGRIRRLPKWATRAGLALLGTRSAERHLGHVARTARSLLRTRILPWPAAGHLPTQYLDETSLRMLREGPPPGSHEPIEVTRTRLAGGLEDVDPTRLAFLGNSATGASRNKVDGAIMHSGVAQWSPYQQPALQSLAASLFKTAPATPAGRTSLGKQPLIEATLTHGLLPEEVVMQPKESPVTSPIDDWYTHELRGDVLEILGGLPFEWSSGYVDDLLASKWAEAWYRRKMALSPHALQAIGMLVSYASYARLSP